MRSKLRIWAHGIDILRPTFLAISSRPKSRCSVIGQRDDYLIGARGPANVFDVTQSPRTQSVKSLLWAHLSYLSSGVLDRTTAVLASAQRFGMGK